MILSVGLDTVLIKRFSDWHTKPEQQLCKLFTPAEIAYCMHIKAKSAERFAARFALKEAFFKAYSTLKLPKKIPFLTLCRSIEVQNKPWVELEIPWEDLLVGSHFSAAWMKSHACITHSADHASGIVIIEYINPKGL